MTEFSSIIITTTFHEPVFHLHTLFLECIEFINSHFPRVIVCCTQATSEEVVDILQKHGLKVILSSRTERIQAYLDTISCAISMISDDTRERILYLDFDRMLHWVKNYPKELLNVLKNVNNYDLVHFGRSTRAFETHPRTQKKTEIMVNQVGSRILNLKETYDLISVCYAFSRKLGESLLNSQPNTEMGFYGSWPIILWGNASHRTYIEVEGQEWETPDRFQKEISELGYEKWLEQFQTPEEWDMRTRLLNECLTEMLDLAEYFLNV